MSGAALVSMGGIIRVPAAGASVRLVIRTGEAAGQQLEIVRNGALVTTMTVDTADEERSYTLTLMPGQWVHVRLRDADGLTALTNPVYARESDVSR
jgi:hypothetical protein